MEPKYVDTSNLLFKIRNLIYLYMDQYIDSTLSRQNGIFTKTSSKIDVSQEYSRARARSLVAPSSSGVILMDWLKETGPSGKVRAQEIFDRIGEKPKNGVIWTFIKYIKDNPTGNSKVDDLLMSEVFVALDIEVGVTSLKNFLRHIVMASK